MTRFYVLMEGPGHMVAVGPFDDFERAGDWGAAHATDEWVGRGSIAVLSIKEWTDKYGKDRG